MTPWNYPFSMPTQHLVAAVAAGCTVIIKPSEFTPHTSALVKEIIGKVFAENEVAVIEGDYTVSCELLKLKFDHIHFTGSPAVGKVVMRAAAEHLTSVTLELGGKSPVIIDETANIDAAAKKITWGKYLNCGQTCIAPDYIIVHDSKKDEFVTKLNANIKKVFGDDAQKSVLIWAALSITNTLTALRAYWMKLYQKALKLKVADKPTKTIILLHPQ